MRAAFRRGSAITVREVDPPRVGPGQVRVRVTACGICGTDVHADTAGASQERTFGHEVAGTIAACGEGVRGLEVGQRMVLESATACGRCANCRNTRQELCTDIQSFFYLGSFGFADEMLSPAACVIPCDDLSPEVACISEPLGVAIDLVRLADITPTSNVLLLGAGPIGLMALALARRLGARRVFVSEYGTQTARCRLARAWGADAVIDPSRDAVKDADFGCAIDRVLVTAPPATLPTAFAVAAKGGLIAFIGIAAGGDPSCTFDANAFHFKKLQLRASFASPALYTPMALQYLREGVVDGEALISHRFPLDRMAEAMTTAQSDPEAVKVVVVP